MKYLILDLRGNADGCLLWWRVNSCGYTILLDDAGRFTAEQIAADPDKNNGKTTLAVPEHIAKGESVTVVPTDGMTLKKITERTKRCFKTECEAWREAAFWAVEHGRNPATYVEMAERAALEAQR